VILFIIFWRIFKLRESAVWATQRKKQDPGKQMRQLKLLMQHFWHRHALLSSLNPAVRCGFSAACCS
jgi:hypothetical protein